MHETPSVAETYIVVRPETNTQTAGAIHALTTTLEVRMQGLSGLMLIGIGVIHSIYGAFLGFQVMGMIASSDFTGDQTRVLVSDLGQEFIFWFLFGGVMMLLIGHFMFWYEKRSGTKVPMVFGLELFAIAIAGVVIMPASGFWLILGVGLYVMAKAHKATAEIADPVAQDRPHAR